METLNQKNIIDIDNENTFLDEYDEGLIDFGVDFDIVGTTSLCPSRRNTAFL